MSKTGPEALMTPEDIAMTLRDDTLLTPDNHAVLLIDQGAVRLVAGIFRV